MAHRDPQCCVHHSSPVRGGPCKAWWRGRPRRVRGHWYKAALPAIRAPMTKRGKFTQAGGSILAVSIIAGSIAGIIVREPSIGFLVGAGAGVLLLTLFWLQERRR